MLHYYYPVDKDIRYLLVNLRLILSCFLSQLNELKVMKTDRYYIFTPTDVEGLLYPHYDYPLPPLSTLNAGFISTEIYNSISSFELMGVTLYVTSDNSSMLLEDLQLFVNNKLSYPTGLDDNMSSRSGLESSLNILKGKFPVYYLHTYKEPFVVLQTLGKILSSNIYLRCDDLSYNNDIWRLPLLDDNMYDSFINLLSEEDNIGVARKVSFLDYLCYKQHHHCYYLDGIMYSKEEISRDISIDRSNLLERLREEITKCKPQFDPFTLESLNELPEADKLNLLQLSDSSCVNLSDLAIEWLITHPYMLNSSFDNEYRVNALIGYYDLVIVDSLVIPGSISTWLRPEIDVSSIEIVDKDGEYVITKDTRIICELPNAVISSYAKAYYVSYAELPDYCVNVLTS